VAELRTAAPWKAELAEAVVKVTKELHPFVSMTPSTSTA